MSMPLSLPLPASLPLPSRVRTRSVRPRAARGAARSSCLRRRRHTRRQLQVPRPPRQMALRHREARALRPSRTPVRSVSCSNCTRHMRQDAHVKKPNDANDQTQNNFLIDEVEDRRPIKWAVSATNISKVQLNSECLKRQGSSPILKC